MSRSLRSVRLALHPARRFLQRFPSGLREAGLALDRYYIPTRYPNGFPQGVPGEYFLAKDADEAIDHANRILEFVRRRLGL